MAEVGAAEINPQQRASQVKEAAESYKTGSDPAAREKILNSSLVVVNDLGIADPNSYQTVRDIAMAESAKGGYMSTVITELNADNLVALANAGYYTKGPKKSLEEAVDRIKKLAEKETKGTESGTGAFQDELFREMNERIQDPNFEDSSQTIGAISNGATPELVREILGYQPALLSNLIAHAESINNEVLRDIIKKKATNLEEPTPISQTQLPEEKDE